MNYKVTLLGIGLALSGATLLLFSRWAQSLQGLAWIESIPLDDLGSTLFGIGVVGIAYDRYTKKDEERNAMRRLREAFRQQAPLMRETVIRGFAVDDDDLKRVATPELLDKLAQNSLALRFGDRQFALEVYGDIRDQAIKASERWYDARVKVRLVQPSPVVAQTGPVVLDAVVQWEYSVAPKHQVRHFTVVSDRKRYSSLAAEGGATSVWFKPAARGIDVSAQSAFELLQFDVDGGTIPIHRSADTASQSYTVDLGADVVREERQVVVAFTYRTRLVPSGHLLHFDFDRPTRGVSVELDYSGAPIADMKLIDYISGGRRARVGELTHGSGAKVISLDYDGWVLPRAGVAFVWTLVDEVKIPASDERADQANAA